MTRPDSLSQVSLPDLLAEIHRRNRELASPEHERLLQTALALEAQMRSLRGFAIPIDEIWRRAGPQNNLSIADALRQLLQGKTLDAFDAAEMLQGSGYKSSAKDFRAVVSFTLRSNPSLFKGVNRGRYTAAEAWKT